MKGNPRINGYVSTTNCRSPNSADSRSKISRVSPGLYNMIKNNISTSKQECLNGTYSKSKSVFTERNKNYKETANLIPTKSPPAIQSHGTTGNCNIKDTNKKKFKLPLRKKIIRATHHEMLQRIESKIDPFNHYQHHWFSSGLERLKLEPISREERLEITRYELNRQLNQIVKSEVGLPFLRHGTRDATGCLLDRKNAPRYPSPTPLMKHRNRNTSGFIIADTFSNSGGCLIDQCRRLTLPCARHCATHITHNADQVLFTSCTAKFADNTQCSMPVFDILHQLPLCIEHARKRDNYKMHQDTKPKKLRKKVKPSAMIRPQKRNKKKKKRAALTPKLPEHQLSENDDLEHVEPDLVEVTQATHHLLEETDISTVLSTIHADEFNDLFSAVNRNGEYEPTREETEELERALAAVDNDVKSLEKLSQSLDTFLDESLDVFHGGGQNGGYAQQCSGSRLMSVQHRQ